ncbi:MAG: transglutaminase domain-containing protein [Microbacter sp.]
MKKTLFFWFVSLLLYWSATAESQTSSNHFLITSQLEKQKQWTGDTAHVWSFLYHHPMSIDERESMEYLYAYMPLSDLLTYPVHFLWENVKQTLLAQQEMPWGKCIPKNIFLQDVLPLRVSDEPLDSFRLVMYPMLKERVQGLNMEQAALEINHWCHEQVSYQMSDNRTLSPLGLMKRTVGRCGEESVFTVTALRTVGIPARQVFTPRWAHTDDNHAWVEVWIDGQWHYMGACEPAPYLDEAWFDAAVKRAMLIKTYTFGPDPNDTSAIVTTDRFSELNLTARYAPVRKIVVHIVDSLNKSVDSCHVNWMVYNYAAFFPLTQTVTNAQGNTSLDAGKGDLMIWAFHRGIWAMQKWDAKNSNDTLILTLHHTIPTHQSIAFTMMPPPAVSINDTVSQAVAWTNNLRLHREDSIRQHEINTFKDTAWANQLANQYLLSVDTVRKLIVNSRGNWAQIASYLKQNAFTSPAYVLALADQLTDKDLSDCNASVLTDHLRWTTHPSFCDASIDHDDFVQYVLSPRIATEPITPWRSFLLQHFSNHQIETFRKNISNLIQWITDSIRITKTANQPGIVFISPEKVFVYRIADIPSRDLFLVAACRSLGIPARFNPHTNKPEIIQDHDWVSVNFQKGSTEKIPTGKLKLIREKNNPMPRYFQNFTIAPIQHGMLHPPFIASENQNEFPCSLILSIGNDLLTTGTRNKNGAVQCQATFFKINAHRTLKLPLNIPTFSDH